MEVQPTPRVLCSIPICDQKDDAENCTGRQQFVDILGSTLALIVLSPVFGLIALAIKMTSTGPVLFRQERLGHYGEKFTLLKFRSMRTRLRQPNQPGIRQPVHRRKSTR